MKGNAAITNPLGIHVVLITHHRITWLIVLYITQSLVAFAPLQIQNVLKGVQLHVKKSLFNRQFVSYYRKVVTSR